MAIGHVLAHVGHAGAVIDGQHFDAAGAAAQHLAQQDFAALRVLDDVGRRFADDDGQLARAHVVEADAARQFVAGAAGRGDLARFADGKTSLPENVRLWFLVVQNSFHFAMVTVVPAPGAVSM
ncbi:hypothetical protein D3C86_367650 [compost metagenome]